MGLEEMRILLISPLPPPAGGIGTWTKKYLTYCAQNKIECKIVDTALQGRRAKNINDKRSVLDEIPRTIRILSQLRKEIENNQPDIVHINSPCTTFGIYRDWLIVKYCRMKKLKTIFHCRCNIEDQVNKQTAKFFFKKIVALSDKVFTLNSFSFRIVETIEHGKTIIIPNFIEASQVDISYQVRPEVKEMTFVGHVQKTKGVEEINEIAKLNPTLRFRLIGPVQKECMNLLWSSNVILEGPKDAKFIKNALKQSDVFIFPSYTEGFSNAVAEAMAAGLPVIASDVGANRDMIENKGGIIVESQNAFMLNEAVQKIMDFETRKRMSIWNRKKVEDYYDISNVMKDILTIYKNLL